MILIKYYKNIEQNGRLALPTFYVIKKYLQNHKNSLYKNIF